MTTPHDLIRTKSCALVAPSTLSPVFALLHDVPPHIPVYTFQIKLQDGSTFETERIFARDFANQYVADLSRARILTHSQQKRIRHHLKHLHMYPISCHLEVLDTEIPTLLLYVYGKRFEVEARSKQRMRQILFALNEHHRLGETSRHILLEQLKHLTITESLAAFHENTEGEGELFDDEGEMVEQSPFYSKLDAHISLNEHTKAGLIHFALKNAIANTIESSSMPLIPECTFKIKKRGKRQLFEFITGGKVRATCTTKRGAKQTVRAVCARYAIPIAKYDSVLINIENSDMQKVGFALGSIAITPAQETYAMCDIDTGEVRVEQTLESKTQIIKTASNLGLLGLCNEIEVRDLIQSAFETPLEFKHPEPPIKFLQTDVHKFYHQ